MDVGKFFQRLANITIEFAVLDIENRSTLAWDESVSRTSGVCATSAPRMLNAQATF